MQDDLKTIRKVFDLIRLLNSPRGKTAQELMRRIGVKKTRIYEMLKMLEDLGYKIQTDKEHRKSFEISVTKEGSSVIDGEELLHLQDILQRSSGNHPLTTSLLNKFNANLSLIPLADALPQLHAERMIQLIRIGLENRRRLLLHNYPSFTRGTLENRIIEPLELTEDCRYIIGWEPKINRQGQFKISRIQDVDVLDETFEAGRTNTPMDIFGLTGEEWMDVKLELSDFAYHLMVEEFPLSARYVNNRRKPVVFDGRVRNWKGIGRFVLGLISEIKVLEPQAFKDYLNEKIREF
jgi:predicted DNA-binding transcriptional regulator YafY